jgi:hypothetical protein
MAVPAAQVPATAPAPGAKSSLLIIGLGAILAMGAVAAFAYWNEVRR